MMNNFNLRRFIEAQDRVYETALEELRAGDKRSHWMWYIFPQIKGLGRSSMSQKFAIDSLEEAKAYLAHAILVHRRVQKVQAWVRVQGCFPASRLGQSRAGAAAG